VAPPVPAGATAQAATQAPSKPAVPVPAGVASAPGAASAPARPGTPATPAAQRAPAAPPVPSAPPRPPSRPAAQPTAILPPPGRPPWYRRLLASPRYLVLAVAGVLILGGAAAFGVVQLTSDEASPPSGQSAAGTPAGDEQEDGDEGERPRRRGARVQPANVTVAVLNGTTVPGLAATLSDRVEDAGFRGGTVADFSPNQQLAESVIHYAPGHEREAAAVGRRLGISQREAATAESQALAGDATVIVIVGADKAQ
jgi:hypothetical protein